MLCGSGKERVEAADALGRPVGGLQHQAEAGGWEEQTAAIVAPRVEHQDDRHLVWNVLQAAPVEAALLLVLWGIMTECLIHHNYDPSFALLCLHQLVTQCLQFHWKIVIHSILYS